jgi:uncharacterized protein
MHPVRAAIAPLGIVTLAVCLTLALVMFFEERLIFFPERIGVGPSPGDDVWIASGRGQRMHGWHVTRPAARATLLHLHGNAGHLESRRGLVLALASLGVNVLAIDYRGYGKSEGGFPSERSVDEDARAAFDFLRARQPALPVVVHGESLGGGAACELALQADVAGLVLQSSFTSVPAMAAVVYPFLPAALVRTRFDNLRKVKEIAAPKLFIHSRSDEIVPFAMGEQLYAAARGPKERLWLSASGHNDALFVDGAEILGAIRRFLVQGGWADAR